MRILFISPLFFLLASCQPSKITQVWVAENTTPAKYKKILVLGVLSENDNELQIKMENHLADDLREMGYLAVAANKIFPYGTFKKGDTANAKTAIEGKGFDGILTIVLLDKKTQNYYVPGKMVNTAEPGRSRRFDVYFNSVTEQIYSPGYYGTETKYIWENNFYDLNNRQLIYTARTRSFDYTSKNTLAHTYGQLMAYSLIKKNILIKPDP